MFLSFKSTSQSKEESPLDSPAAPHDFDNRTTTASQSHFRMKAVTLLLMLMVYLLSALPLSIPPTDSSSSSIITPTVASNSNTSKDDDYEEEDDNMDAAELSKFLSSSDPSKMVMMQAILLQFLEEQMSISESFRRSALHKANIRRLVSITGTRKISLPMTIVVCGMAKMFFGEPVETECFPLPVANFKFRVPNINGCYFVPSSKGGVSWQVTCYQQ